MSAQANPVPEGNNPPSNVTPPASAPKAKRTRGKFNKKQTAELNKASLIAVQAAKPAHLNQLTAQGKGVAEITALVSKIVSAGQCSTGKVSGDAEGKSATLSARGAKKVLMQRLRQIQAKAKLKYQFDDPAKLQAYLIGQPIGQSRPLLEQSAQTILAKAGQERPGNVDTAFLTEGQAERAAYVGSKTTQQDKKSLASAERIARDQFIASVQRDRIELQLAADAAWPAGVEANAPIRVLFYLDPKKAYNA